MTPEKAREFIREYARFKDVGLGKHCREQMFERGVTMTDVMQVLMWGRIEELKPDDGRWKCKISGEDVDGELLVFIASFCMKEKYIHCITVF